MTTKNITINAETISNLLDEHKEAVSTFEKAEKAGSPKTECFRASVIAIERMLDILGIDWTEEEQAEDTEYCEKVFAEEIEALESKARKTGVFFGDCNENQRGIAESHKCSCMGAGMVSMDWYITRKDHQPVIRVKSFFPTLASRKVYKNGWVTREMTWGCTNREQKFPFTEAGYEAACKLYDSLMAE